MKIVHSSGTKRSPSCSPIAGRATLSRRVNQEDFQQIPQPPPRRPARQGLLPQPGKHRKQHQGDHHLDNHEFRDAQARLRLVQIAQLAERLRDQDLAAKRLVVARDRFPPTKPSHLDPLDIWRHLRLRV